MFQAMTAPQQASLQSLNLQFSTKRARGTGRRGLHFPVVPPLAFHFSPLREAASSALSEQIKTAARGHSLCLAGLAKTQAGIMVIGS